MTTKYHINDRGEPGVCSAVHKCRFGRDLDQHFDTVAEARTAYEQEKVNELFPNGIEKDNLGKRELNKLVKYTNDQEILLQGVETGSPRIRASVLKNRNAEAEVLKNLYATVKEGAGADTEKAEIVSHRNYPASEMSNTELSKALRHRTKLSLQFRDQLLADDGINEKHMDTLSKLSGNQILTVAGNKNNGLTKDSRSKLLKKDSQTKLAALRQGMLPATEIRNLDAGEFKNLSFSADRIENPAHLDEITGVALTEKHGLDNSERAIERVIQNNNLSERAIKAIARSNVSEKYSSKYTDVDVSLYRLPSIDDSTRKLLIDRSPEVASIARVDEITEKAGGSQKLRERIVKDSEEFQAGNSYRKTRVEFDKDELAKLGMGKDEVLTLMNKRAWNADFKYDEESGVFIGGIDSSD